MSECDDMNREVVAEFRSNQGVVDTAAGGYFKGKPMLILHTTGAKTGAERANPLMYLDEGDRRFVFASKGGAPDNPDWYYNLIAASEGTVERGADTYPVTVHELTGKERDRIYDEQARRYPGFADYARQTAGVRTIPVLALRRS